MKLYCVVCESANVRETIEEEKVPVWPEDHPKHFKVSVLVPVLTCDDCKFQWTDSRAEDLRDKAIKGDK